MANTRDRRVAKELQDIQEDRDNSGVYATLADGTSLTNLHGSIPGPPDTPYAGGTYEIKIKIPSNYPFKPPEMTFLTRVFHPNISSQTGAICLDILRDAWSPVQTIKTALLSLRMLLEFPNPKDPQDYQVAKLAMDDPHQYARTAQQWAINYAGAPTEAFDIVKYITDNPQPIAKGDEQYMGYHPNVVNRFTSMGFEVPAIIEAFTRAGIPRRNGADFHLEDAYIGDVMAHLLGDL